MAFSLETVRSMLGKYKFRDLTLEELKNVHKAYPNFSFSMDTYTFKDGSFKHLLNCKGTVPTKYMGNFYNIPIRLWILDSHPFAPPLCFLMPTMNMGIRVGKHIDTEGRIYLPYLQSWSHPKSTIIGLIHEMIAKFDEELPMYSLSAADVNKQFELLSYISQVTEGVSDIEVNDKRRAAPGGDHKDAEVNKVTVVGAGDLGMACVMAVLAKGFKDKTLLLDISEVSVKGGGAMDLEIFSLPDVEVSRDFSAAEGSSVVVLTVNAWTNAQSYLSVIQSNVDLLRGIVPILAHACPHSVLIVASQPAFNYPLCALVDQKSCNDLEQALEETFTLTVLCSSFGAMFVLFQHFEVHHNAVDIMTYVVWKLSGLPKNQVIGIGCNLDSERFRYAIENVLNAHSWGKEAWIVGEHGEEKVHAWSKSALSRSEPDGTDHTSFQEQLANRNSFKARVRALEWSLLTWSEIQGSPKTPRKNGQFNSIVSKRARRSITSRSFLLRGPEVVIPHVERSPWKRATEVLKSKGQRSWSVGLSVADLVDSILKNKMKTHSISTLAKGYCNINSDVFLSLPCVLGINGAIEVVRTALNDGVVIQKLQSSAATMHTLQQQLRL